jgi:hypothetical protein
MKYMELSTEGYRRQAITTIWRAITVDTVQSVFRGWMRRIIWGIEDNGEYYLSRLDPTSKQNWPEWPEDVVNCSAAVLLRC